MKGIITTYFIRKSTISGSYADDGNAVEAAGEGNSDRGEVRIRCLAGDNHIDLFRDEHLTDTIRCTDGVVIHQNVARVELDPRWQSPWLLVDSLDGLRELLPIEL